jgi:hypothetical protein
MNRSLTIIIFTFLFANALSQDKSVTDYGVEINFSAGPEIFPKAWLTKEINAKATPIDTAEFGRSAAIITKALNKYPVELIKKHLTKVYVVAYLEFYGQSAGGSNSTSEIYLTNRGKALGYSDFWIEQAFHAEFAAILFRNYSFLFDKKKWVSYNKSVRYGQSGIIALKQGKSSEEFDLELNKKGILALYGTASIEADFKMFAANLFLSKTGFWQIVETHTRIRKKTEMAIQFYGSVDFRFDQKYFRLVSKE